MFTARCSSKCPLPIGFRLARILILSWVVAASLPSEVRGSELDGADARRVAEIAGKHAAEMSAVRNDAGKPYVSARSSQAVDYQNDVASVFMTVRKNLADRAVFELVRADYRKSGKDWSRVGEETIASNDQYVLLSAAKLPSRGQSFELQHGDYALSFSGADVWPLWVGNKLAGFTIAGKGTLTYTPPNELQLFYLRERLKNDGISKLQEPVTVAHLLFHPDDLGGIVGRLSSPLPLDRESYQSTGTPADAPELAKLHDYTGLKFTTEPSYENGSYTFEQYDVTPGSKFIMAKGGAIGWLNYQVDPAGAESVLLGAEDKGILCNSILPEERDLDPRVVEKKEEPEPVEVVRVDAKVLIDESSSLNMIVDYDVQLRALEDATSLDFSMFNGKEDNASGQVDDVYQDGTPVVSAWEGRFQNRIHLHRALKKGETTDVRIRFRNANYMLYKLDPGFTYVANRGGIPWTPFLGLLRKGAPFQLELTLPSRYTAMSFAPIAEQREEGGMRIVKFKGDEPINFPTFIYGDYNVKQDEVDGIPVTMYTGKTMKSIANFNLGPGERLPVGSPNLTINRGKIDAAMLEAKNALAIYKRTFGTDYPHAKLDLVNAPLDGASAQSPTGLVYVGNHFLVSDASLNEIFPDVKTSDFRGVVAHELAHQWWGGQVWNANDYHYWFVESLSEISAAIYLAIVEGPAAYLNKVKSWKDDALLTSSDVAVQHFWRASTGRGRISYYQKGPYVFHMFGQLFGTDKLEAAMKNLVATYHGQGITTRDLQATFEETVQTDLEWFFDQWVRGTGIPTIRYKASWFRNEAGKWVVQIDLSQVVQYGNKLQPDKAYTVLVPVYVHLKDGKTNRIKVLMQDKTRTQSVELDTEPMDVTVLDQEETLARVERLQVGRR